MRGPSCGNCGTPTEDIDENGECFDCADVVEPVDEPVCSECGNDTGPYGGVCLCCLEDSDEAG